MHVLLVLLMLFGELAMRFVMVLYAVPMFLMFVGYGFVKRGAGAAVVATTPDGRRLAQKQSLDGGLVLLLGLALGFLVFFRMELFRCVAHLF